MYDCILFKPIRSQWPRVLQYLNILPQWPILALMPNFEINDGNHFHAIDRKIVWLFKNKMASKLLIHFACIIRCSTNWFISIFNNFAGGGFFCCFFFFRKTGDNCSIYLNGWIIYQTIFQMNEGMRGKNRISTMRSLFKWMENIFIEKPKGEIGAETNRFKRCEDQTKPNDIHIFRTSIQFRTVLSTNKKADWSS